MNDRIMKPDGQDLGVIGLGCMGLSHAYGAAVPHDRAVRLVREAFEMGYRFFDTAAVYTGQDENGHLSVNERIVGEALKDVRDQVVIATKYGVAHGETGLVTDGSIMNLRRSLEQSLENLQTEYVDLFYLHRIDPKVPVETVAEEMQRQIEAGRIKGWGLSEATEDQIRRANAVCPLSAVQNRYSLMARWHEPVIDLCGQLGIVFVAFSPLANGFLSSRYDGAKFEDPADFRRNMPQFTEEGAAAGRQLLDLVEKIAARHACTPAQVSLAWMTEKYPNLIPIPGSTKESRIRENLEAARIELSPAEMAELDRFSSVASLPVYGGARIER